MLTEKTLPPVGQDERSPPLSTLVLEGMRWVHDRQARIPDTMLGDRLVRELSCSSRLGHSIARYRFAPCPTRWTGWGRWERMPPEVQERILSTKAVLCDVTGRNEIRTFTTRELVPFVFPLIEDVREVVTLTNENAGTPFSRHVIDHAAIEAYAKELDGDLGATFEAARAWLRGASRPTVKGGALIRFLIAEWRGDDFVRSTTRSFHPDYSPFRRNT